MNIDKCHTPKHFAKKRCEDFFFFFFDRKRQRHILMQGKIQEKDEESSHPRKQNYNETNTRKYKVDTNNFYKLGQPNGVARR